MMVLKLFVAAALCVVAFAAFERLADTHCGAEEPGGQRAEEKLPGSRLSVADAVTQADQILIGVITRLDIPNPGEIGVAQYSGTIDPGSSLKGPSQYNMLRASFSVNSMEANEEAPAIKKNYIFFLKKGPSGKFFSVIKILNATKQNIQVVKDAIKAAATQPATQN